MGHPQGTVSESLTCHIHIYGHIYVEVALGQNSQMYSKLAAPGAGLPYNISSSKRVKYYMDIPNALNNLLKSTSLKTFFRTQKPFTSTANLNLSGPKQNHTSYSQMLPSIVGEKPCANMHLIQTIEMTLDK